MAIRHERTVHDGRNFCGSDTAGSLDGTESVSYTHLTLPTTPYV